jgi:para-nitrobenzyl esterase
LTEDRNGAERRTMQLTRRSALGIMGAGAMGSALAGTGAARAEVGDGADTFADTQYGKIRGRVYHGVHTFKGIPYGKPTGGSRRFMRSEPPDSWLWTRDALDFGDTSPQTNPDAPNDRSKSPFNIMIGITDMYPQSEDCLRVNVWTPGVADNTKRPVMVNFHSGGFVVNSASAPVMDGTNLARRGNVVFVSFNHRLSIFGHMQLTTDKSSPFFAAGNVGMLDIVDVLKWVKNNIANFGGDPNNVTVFGQSGGGQKVSNLLAMPEATGLFHRAIIISGATVRAREMSYAQKVTSAVFSELGIAEGDIAALQKVPVDQMMRAHWKTVVKVGPGAGVATFGPVVDGVNLPQHPFDPAAPDISRQVPLIIGNMRNEEALFMRLNQDLPAMTMDKLVENLRKLYQGKAADVAKRYAERYPSASPYELYASILGDNRFGVFSKLIAERKSAQGAAPVWRYLIDWKTDVVNGRFLSCHELDVALFYGNVEAARGLNNEAPEAYDLSNKLVQTYTSFARTGNPNNSTIPNWPQYGTDGPVMVFSPAAHVENKKDGDLLAFIEPETFIPTPTMY